MNYRYIIVENTGNIPVNIHITNYDSGPKPQILATLISNEMKHLGINTPDGPEQYLWVYSISGKSLIAPTILRRDVKHFVLRQGMLSWWLQYFNTGTLNLTY